jgi:hypothetical protein
MAELLAINRAQTPPGQNAGGVIQVQIPWDVVAATNNDTVYIADLPAFHRLVPELCNVIADGDTPALTYSLCVVEDANALISGQAVVASTFTRTAVTTYELAYTLGVSSSNRKVYFKLTAAPATAGGLLVLNLAYAADT